MKKQLFLVPLVMLAVTSPHAQTNVSGGIYADTTWTLANSPYIVTDTTVVFPGVTLTIEPGVTVKFEDNMHLEIRNATLIANGISTDSITFTSNSLSPAPGIWGGIWLNGALGATAFNYCTISYATAAMETVSNILYIKNSSFVHNQTGIGSISSVPVDSCIFKYNSNDGIVSMIGTLNFCSISNNNYAIEEVNNVTFINCTIDSNTAALGAPAGGVGNCNFYGCHLCHNQQAVLSNFAGINVFRNCVIDSNSISGFAFGNRNNADSVIDCEIIGNGTGGFIGGNYIYMTGCDVEYNNVGIAAGPNGIITKCRIVNNNVGIQLSPATQIFCNEICNNTSYGVQMTSSVNGNIANNYWCTTDSATIATEIYDGYNNANFGLLTFLPLDSSCYLSTGVNEIFETDNPIKIFPNPFSTSTQISFSHQLKDASLLLYNIYGQRIKSIEHLSSDKIILSREGLPDGIYIFEVLEKNERTAIGKLVID